MVEQASKNTLAFKAVRKTQLSFNLGDVLFSNAISGKMAANLQDAPPSCASLLCGVFVLPRTRLRHQIINHRLSQLFCDVDQQMLIRSVKDGYLILLPPVIVSEYLNREMLRVTESNQLLYHNES